VAVCFKQAISSSVLISGILLRVKGLHIVKTLGIQILMLLIAGLMVSSGDTAFSTKLFQVFFLLKSWVTQNFITIKTSWNTND
jgi:hypothetical protein